MVDGGVLEGGDGGGVVPSAAGGGADREHALTARRDGCKAQARETCHLRLFFAFFGLKKK